MRINLIVVGQLKSGPYFELYTEYKKRIRWPIILREVIARNMPNADSSAMIKREGKLLADLIPNNSIVAVLDERGLAISSEDFAEKISEWSVSGVNDIVFIVGGANGLDSALYKRANLTLSFGRMTWPHMLARVMLVEQIYRSQQIISGHPYHKKG